MLKTEDRPVIKIKLTAPDWAVEFIGLTMLILLFVLPLFYLPQLPERIPIHFNAAGLPDGYGSRSSIWFLPATGVFMYILLTVVSAFPQIYNFPVKITEKNAQVQYRLATRFIRILKTLILILFLYLTYQTINSALSKTLGLGKSFLPVFLIITIFPIIFYVVKALNNKHGN
jgi:uncharacterized membrane protein